MHRLPMSLVLPMKMEPLYNHHRFGSKCFCSTSEKSSKLLSFGLPGANRPLSNVHVGLPIDHQQEHRNFPVLLDAFATNNICTRSRYAVTSSTQTLPPTQTLVSVQSSSFSLWIQSDPHHQCDIPVANPQWFLQLSQHQAVIKVSLYALHLRI